MTKVIIALAVLLLLILLAIGGVYVYQTLAPAASQTTQEDTMEDPEKAKKGPLGRMRDAETPSDIPSLLTYAMDKSLDAVGWIDVPGTDISNVVMQGSDNVYYERRDEDGNPDIYGCYFLDVECTMGKRSDFLPNTIIYGHSDLTDNPDGPRFSQLFRFADDAFANEHKYMYVTTLEGRYTFEIFSVFYTDTSFDYIRVHMTDEEALALAEDARSRSVRDYGIQPAAGDKLLTLSTCSVRDGNDGTHRFVVMGRLIEEEPVTLPTLEEAEADALSEEPQEAQDEAPESSRTQSQPQPANAAQPQIPQPVIPQPGDIQQPVVPDIPQVQPVIPTTPDIPQQPQIPPVLP